jgi:hypothetical protein
MLTKLVERLFFSMGAEVALDFLDNQTPTPEICKLQDWVIARFCAVVDGAVEVRAHELD